MFLYCIVSVRRAAVLDIQVIDPCSVRTTSYQLHNDVVSPCMYVSRLFVSEFVKYHHDRVTLNNASDYRTNGHYRTPNPNPSPLAR